MATFHETESFHFSLFKMSKSTLCVSLWIYIAFNFSVCLLAINRVRVYIAHNFWYGIIIGIGFASSLFKQTFHT